MPHSQTQSKCLTPRHHDITQPTIWLDHANEKRVAKERPLKQIDHLFGAVEPFTPPQTRALRARHARQHSEQQRFEGLVHSNKTICLVTTYKSSVFFFSAYAN